MYKTFVFTAIDSTNRAAFQLAQQGIEHGSAVLAEMQTNGRGRLDRSWHSPPKTGLYCSIVIRPDIPVSEYPKITLVAGLSVANAIDEVCGCTTSVKWPNDIFLNGKKLGGILTEASPVAPENFSPFAVVGIGVNINNHSEEFPLDVAGRATSLLLENGRTNDIRAIFEAIRAGFLVDISRLEREGFGEILADWRKRDMLQGKVVRWLKQDGGILCGKCLGPDPEGLLVIEDAFGHHHQIVSGDVLLQVGQ